MTTSDIKLIECPRDAMQGLHDYIPAKVKARYVNQLLIVGFDTIDCGSFVSPKAIPQMKDTGEVLDQLDLDSTHTKLLVIVANQRGASEAVQYEQIDYLGYPFSISETFQLRNTNATIEESLGRVADIQDLCLKHNKSLVVYLSMGFGNPYGDVWNVDICAKWVELLYSMGINIMALSDTIGIANASSINYLFSKLAPMYPHVELGAHFHTTPHTWHEKIHTAYSAGCRRFDGAIRGYGGCPMAKDDLTGNMPTENIVRYLYENDIPNTINQFEFINAMAIANEVFPK